jgi:hypothetical protein
MVPMTFAILVLPFLLLLLFPVSSGIFVGRSFDTFRLYMLAQVLKKKGNPVLY